MWKHTEKQPEQLKGFQTRPSIDSNIFKQNDSSATVQNITDAQNRGTNMGICNSICKFANTESNCWLNATLQSIFHLQVVQDQFKQLTADQVVQMSSMPGNLAALIQVYLQNPWHIFDGKTIHGVTQELAASISGLSLSMHNDPLDLLHPLLIWLHQCGVRTTGIAEQKNICTKCALSDVHVSDAPHVFTLPLTKKRDESLYSLFEQSISDGEVDGKCTSCDSAMKRQLFWCESPDIIALSVARVGSSGMVLHKPVISSDTIEIPMHDGSKKKFKLVSIVCHAGAKAKVGHFWTHLRDGNVVIRADDTSIGILQPAKAVEEAKQNGYIYLYVKCYEAPLNAGLTIVDNSEGIGCDSALPITGVHETSTAEDDVLCNESPNHSMSAISLPILTFVKHTSAFQKCHTRLSAAAAQSPLFARALEKLKAAKKNAVSESQPFSMTNVCTMLGSFVKDILGAPFLGDDLFCLKSLGTFICTHCGDKALKHMSQLIVQPLQVSQKDIYTLAQNFIAQPLQCEKCKKENTLSTHKVIHSPQTLLLLLKSGTKIPKRFSLSCLYNKNHYAVSSICTFSDKSPYVSLYTQKKQLWHSMTNASTPSVNFEVLQNLLKTDSFFVVSYEKTKSVKLINFQQVKQEHKCSDRCKQAIGAPDVRKLLRGTDLDEDFACVVNGEWLSDKTIDQYNQLLLSSVKKTAHICPSTFVSQELRSIFSSMSYQMHHKPHVIGGTLSWYYCLSL